jgi:hypothetical protein
MTDELTPSDELASAAFDREVASDVHARVAGDAALSAEVESFAQIRAQLIDVRVPASSREDAIAAALAVFDEARGLPVAPVAANVFSLGDRRKRQQRWLMGAAAAAITAIVVAGVVNSSTTDYKSSSQSLGTGAQDSQSGGAAPAKVAAATAASAGGVTAGTAADVGTAAGGQINAIPGPAVVTPWALAPSFTTANELAAFAGDPSFGQITAASTAAPADSTTTKTATAYDTSTVYNTTCLNGVTTPFAAVVFQGQQVLAIRDATGTSLRVIDPRTCNTVITIGLR